MGDLVLRETATSKPDQLRKLMPNWEGPYQIIAMPHIQNVQISFDGHDTDQKYLECSTAKEVLSVMIVD